MVVEDDKIRLLGGGQISEDSAKAYRFNTSYYACKLKRTEISLLLLYNLYMNKAQDIIDEVSAVVFII